MVLSNNQMQSLWLYQITKCSPFGYIKLPKTQDWFYQITSLKQDWFYQITKGNKTGYMK